MPEDAVGPASASHEIPGIDWKSTWLHFFLVATPGSWQPTEIRSDLRGPRTTEEREELVRKTAEMLGTPTQYVRHTGSYELSAERFVDEGIKAKESAIVVPNRNLIVPPGVQR